MTFKFKAFPFGAIGIILLFLMTLALAGVIMALFRPGIHIWGVAKAWGVFSGIGWCILLFFSIKKTELTVSDGNIKILRNNKLLVDTELRNLKKIAYEGPACVSFVFSGKTVTFTNLRLTRRQRQEQYDTFNEIVLYFVDRHHFRPKQRSGQAFQIWDYLNPIAGQVSG